MMAAQMKISHDDAAKRFDDAQAKMQRTKDQAVQTAKDAADRKRRRSPSKASFAAFGVLLLGSIAAAIGGSIAAQRRLIVTQRIVPR